MDSQSRIKSWVMWAGIIATVLMGYIGSNGTAAIGGTPQIDSAILWICGLIAIVSHINNPTDSNDL